MIDYIDLADYGIKFKNLISGPAPVGRILNYLILIGEGKLMHKNGARDLQLNNYIASAWCSEFMVGLNLSYYVDGGNTNIYPIYLTSSGKKLYDLLKECRVSFDENDDDNCKKQLISYNQAAYELFFSIFKNSPVCINLYRYICNASTNKFSKATFLDDYFECFKVRYEGGVYNRNSRTSTAKNRVPSLIQLCHFFGCVDIDANNYTFDVEKLKTVKEYKFITIDETKLRKLKSDNNDDEKIIKNLIENFGVDGTVAREVVVRNSSLQALFRNNLIAKEGCKCAICNKKLEEVLIASHIVPFAESETVEEKADYENGLLLCALHDKLFDKHLISFDFNNGKLMYSNLLNDCLQEYQLCETLSLESRFLTTNRKLYLLKHNIAFRERND